MTDMTPEQITKALDAGIIDAAQADAMRKKDGQNLKPANDIDTAVIGDEENMRFVRSFSDVFIAIGIGLLVLGLFATIGMFGGGVLYLAGAVLLWLMCEYFGRKRRAHFPTLLLAFAYLIFVHTGLSAVLDMGAFKFCAIGCDLVGHAFILLALPLAICCGASCVISHHDYVCNFGKASADGYFDDSFGACTVRCGDNL